MRQAPKRPWCRKPAAYGRRRSSTRCSVTISKVTCAELNRQMRDDAERRAASRAGAEGRLASNELAHEELDGTEQTAHHSSPRGGPLAESDGRFEGAGFPAANKDILRNEEYGCSAARLLFFCAGGARRRDHARPRRRCYRARLRPARRVELQMPLEKRRASSPTPRSAALLVVVPAARIRERVIDAPDTIKHLGVLAEVASASREILTSRTGMLSSSPPKKPSIGSSTARDGRGP